MKIMLKSVGGGEEAVLKSGLFHRVYLPEGNLSKSPCVVMVHGRAGNAKMMWVFSKVFNNYKPIVVTPQAPVEDPLRDFSWWQIDETRPPDVETAVRLAEKKFPSAFNKLEKFIASLPELYGADPKQIHCIGFSQGAGLLSVLSLKEPSLFKSVTLLAGFIPRAVTQTDLFVSKDVLSKKKTLPNYFIAHGTVDPLVPLTKAQEAVSYLEKLGANVSFYTDPVKHKVGPTSMKALEIWLGKRL